MLAAKPKTIEENIKRLEQSIDDVRTGKVEPPRGYQKMEWLQESYRQLQIMKEQMMKMPIG